MKKAHLLQAASYFGFDIKMKYVMCFTSAMRAALTLFIDLHTAMGTKSMTLCSSHINDYAIVVSGSTIEAPLGMEFDR